MSNRKVPKVRHGYTGYFHLQRALTALCNGAVHTLTPEYNCDVTFLGILRGGGTGEVRSKLRPETTVSSAHIRGIEGPIHGCRTSGE